MEVVRMSVETLLDGRMDRWSSGRQGVSDDLVEIGLNPVLVRCDRDAVASAQRTRGSVT